MSGSAFIALGTNQPFEGLDGPALITRAIAALVEAGLEVAAASGTWRTPAWPPGSDQPDFHNAVVDARTTIESPRALFEVLRKIETAFGRERRERWGPRTLDLDILAMDRLISRQEGIIIPHPLIQERAFVLAPLAEIAPDWVHPSLGLSARELLARVKQPIAMQRIA